ncbi:putative MFS transporter [Truncatella angustata]|uniref:MFS transporter n=1 Tax=Truncatella angustata TaxID=152316 RepID=A0A9P8UGH7_9PEZI|nr:putative MFS transporter [Truncatella angustata]KAH6651688.1 putative MFS transporter [Truncatella angustata]
MLDRTQSAPKDATARPSARSGKDLPTWRKYLILFVVSWMTLCVTFSSTSLLVATPEISEDLSTTSEILNVTNAGVLIAMGLSSLIWSPLSDIFGRRLIYNIAIFFLFAPSIGTALAPNMGTFTAMRMVSGFTGTYFMVAGQTVIADIFEPVVRGRATGFFMVGSVAGPAFGPCIGGIIVTFSNWRAVYWLQTAMSGLGFVLSILVIPTIRRETDSIEDEKRSPWTACTVLERFNPLRVFKLLLRPNILLADLTCGLLACTQYGLLTSVRHVINPRFNLTTPLVSGLIYIAPGVGFFVGSVVGGRLSDRTVKNYIVKREGTRLPKDRLNSGLGGLFIVLPISMLLYGWSLQKGFGGLALPIVAGFWVGVGLMGTFNALNTYTAEVSPAEKAEVICSKYIVQYIFGAACTAAVVPLIDAIGVGWAFTLFVALDILGGVLVLFVARLGPKTWV